MTERSRVLKRIGLDGGTVEHRGDRNARVHSITVLKTRVYESSIAPHNDYSGETILISSTREQISDSSKALDDLNDTSHCKP